MHLLCIAATRKTEFDDLGIAQFGLLLRSALTAALSW